MLPRLVRLPPQCSIRDWFGRLKSFYIFSLPLQCPLWEGIGISGPSHVIFTVPYLPLLFIFHFNTCKTGMDFFYRGITVMGKKSTSASSCSRDAVGFFSLLPRNHCVNRDLAGMLSCEKCKKSCKKVKTFMLEMFTYIMWKKKKGMGWGRRKRGQEVG